MFLKWTSNAPFIQALVLLATSVLLLLAGTLPRGASRDPRPLRAPAPPARSTAAPAPAPAQATPRADRGVALLTRALYEPGFARPHAELCPLRGARLRLLILVASAPAHAARRRAARLTWGLAAARRGLAVGFVLGRPPPPPALRAALDREDALHGDLIEGRSGDSRSNLTLKTVSMQEWKEAYCPHAQFLLKVDDDVFVNVERLERFAAGRRRARAAGAVWGALRARVRPAREPWHALYAPPEQFSGAVFPDFVRGAAYLVAAAAARRLARAAPAQRFLRLEAVFATGVLAAARGVRRAHARGFLRRGRARRAGDARRWVAARAGRHHDHLWLWRRLC